MSTIADLNKLKVADLRQELTARGLDIKGNKPDLVARLAAALNTSPPATTPSTPAPTTTPSSAITTPSSTTPTTQPTPLSTEPKQAVPTTPVTPAQPITTPAATPVPTNQDGGEDAEEGEEVDITQMSDAERKRARAERFGIPLQQTEADKNSQRATRFGLGQSGLSKSGELKGLVDGDKIEARKKRFGVVESSPSSGVKRSAHHVSVNVPKAQRLGIPVKAVRDVDAKKQARLARFGAAAQSPLNNEDEEKKRKRVERFGGAAALADAGKRLRVDKPLEQQTI